MGYGMGAGATDGPGTSPFTQGMRQFNGGSLISKLKAGLHVIVLHTTCVSDKCILGLNTSVSKTMNNEP